MSEAAGAFTHFQFEELL